MRCTNSGGYQGPPREPEQIEELTAEVVSSLEEHLGLKVEEPPWMMEEPGLTDVLPSRSKTPRRGGGKPPWKGPCWGEGSPLEGPGYHGHPGGRDRAAEPVHHKGPAGGPCPLQKPELPQMEISGMEQEALPSAAGGEPCPLLWISPSLEGSSIWRR